MRKTNGADDPWCRVAVEEVEIDGVKVSVHGLSIGKMNELRKVNASDEDFSLAIIAECCKRDDGIEITRQNVNNFRADVVNKLNDVIIRVNGFKPGNLSATAGDVSSSA